MFVVFDENNYVKFLSTTTQMEGSIELPDDDSLNLTYLTCYKLNSDGNGLVLDAEKVTAQKDKLGAISKIYELKQQLAASDYKVLRKMREDALGIESEMSENEYLQLEAERESITRQIRELEDGEKLVTDISEILKEGEQARKEKEEKLKEINDTISKIIPEIKTKVENLITNISDGTLVQEVFEKVKENLSEIFNFGNDENSENDGKENTGNLSDILDAIKDKLNGKDKSTSEDEGTEDVFDETSTTDSPSTSNQDTEESSSETEAEETTETENNNSETKINKANK